MARSLNPRLAKFHRSYAVDEVARLWGVHRNTVRAWLKAGLRTVDSCRPTLIRGKDLVEFLTARRRANRRPCAPGEVFCVRCRSPRRPAAGRAEYRPLTSALGNIVGLCPVCGCAMFRRVNRARLDDVRGSLEVLVTEALGGIGESR